VERPHRTRLTAAGVVAGVVGWEARVRRGAHALDPPEAWPRREGGCMRGFLLRRHFRGSSCSRFPRVRPRIPCRSAPSPPSVGGVLERRISAFAGRSGSWPEARAGRPAGRGALAAVLNDLEDRAGAGGGGPALPGGLAAAIAGRRSMRPGAKEVAAERARSSGNGSSKRWRGRWDAFTPCSKPSSVRPAGLPHSYGNAGLL
jgi:hypothetical protein